MLFSYLAQRNSASTIGAFLPNFFINPACSHVSWLPHPVALNCSAYKAIKAEE